MKAALGHRAARLRPGRDRPGRGDEWPGARHAPAARSRWRRPRCRARILRAVEPSSVGAHAASVGVKVGDSTGDTVGPRRDGGVEEPGCQAPRVGRERPWLSSPAPPRSRSRGQPAGREVGDLETREPSGIGLLAGVRSGSSTFAVEVERDRAPRSPASIEVGQPVRAGRRAPGSIAARRAPPVLGRFAGPAARAAGRVATGARAVEAGVEPGPDRVGRRPARAGRHRSARPPRSRR